YALVGYSPGDPCHQPVLVDPVEELFQVNVHDPVVAFSDKCLCLGHSLMGGSARSKPVAVLGERRVPAFLQDLQQRLLDQAIDNARDAELPDPAIRFGDFHPLDRLRLIGPLEQLVPNGWPVFPKVAHGSLDGHAIDAGTTLVLPNALPRSFEVVTFAHFLHEPFIKCRALGFPFRHGRFGPSSIGSWGFTPVARRGGQMVLDFRPHSAHEIRVLLTTSDRSGLRPAFPARPIRCLRLSALECLTSLADCLAYYALC